MAVSTIDPNGLNIGQIGGTRNKVLNGSMQVSQRATSFSGGTANANDAYTLDRWYILSEGSDSVDVDQIADSPDTGGKCIRLDVETTGEKFGIAQIVEAVNCTGLIGNTVTLSFAAKVSDARIDTIKAGIVAWSGTADTVTSDIVSSWGADGTTPTLIANATFENTPADLGVTTSWATYTVTANVDTASTANLILFIWSDDATNPLAGDFLYITNVQLELGDTATPFEHRSYGQELALCQRYYEKSYNPDVAPATNTQAGRVFVIGRVQSVNVIDYVQTLQFSVAKRANPTFTFYKSDGSSSDWETLGGDKTPLIQNSGASNFAIYFTALTTLTVGDAGWAYGHWVASAEL
jgi:hypothetical protein